MAFPMPTINSVDFPSQRVNYTDHTGRTKTDRFGFMPKNGKIAVLKHCGFKFTGKTPLGWSDDELANAWQLVLADNGDKSPTPQPTPTPKETPKMATPSTPTKPKASSGSLDEMIRQIVVDTVGDTDIIAPMMEEMASLKDAITKIQPKVTEIKIGEHEVRKLDGIQHHMFAKVLANIASGVPSYLVGPAGTGKSTIAQNASQALGLEFRSKSCSSQSTESSLLGYMSATGDYVGTGFREAFEHGYVYLLDEVDNGNANILTVLNSALSNNFMAFPDGMVKRHENFVLIATANTFGHGATAEYVGRNPLDAAFLDRFASLTIGYDNEVEEAMLQSVGLDSVLATKWLKVVRQCRQNATDYGLRVVVSPRATVHGAKMLRHDGIYNFKEVVEATILKGAKPEVSSKVLQGVAL
jgi:cobaltochelatase CobS